MFEEHLSSSFLLTIVSNDPVLNRVILPSGVEWKQKLNRQQILSVYQGGDLFVFPTEQDYMPQVLAEALACGLPCMAADVGGISGLIVHGQNGILMGPGAPAALWAEKIIELFSQPENLASMAVAARAFAVKSLSEQGFAQLIQELVVDLCRA
jgi:glycosyltransferase involved in cell wall biosynthesis